MERTGERTEKKELTGGYRVEKKRVWRTEWRKLIGVEQD